jgi:bifunctional DNA-binding transcriptional regulator/antitoxin component of YhaV-PrlF toxin-antitoxin module
MIYTSTLTSKGQVTIPKTFRDLLMLGDKSRRVVFSLNKSGDVVVKRSNNLDEVTKLLGKPTFRDPLTLHEKERGDHLLKKYKFT